MQPEYEYVDYKSDGNNDYTYNSSDYDYDYDYDYDSGADYNYESTDNDFDYEHEPLHYQLPYEKSAVCLSYARKYFSCLTGQKVSRSICFTSL